MSSDLTVGLTGGIASGKTTAAAIFEHLGARIIDADRIAHKLTAPSTPLAMAILAHFGDDFAKAGDTRCVDRKRLGAHVFRHPEAKAWLEALLHPAIREGVCKRLATPHTAPYQIVVIPLLKDRTTYPALQRICWVSTPTALQRERLAKRDGLESQRLSDMLAAQVPQRIQRAMADDVLNNAGTLAELEHAVHTLHARYSSMVDERSKRWQA